jgi:GT2 family glycosyltransferase
MTASYSIPETISARLRFRSNPVRARNIRVVIPTYKDWDGLRVTLDSLLNLKTPPKKIAVANDNPDPIVPEWLHSYPVDVVNYPGNLGPAQARNRAFGLCSELPLEKTLGALTAAIAGRKGSLPDYIRNGYCADLKYRDFVESPTHFEWTSEFDWVYFTDCGCTHDPDLFLRFEKAWQNTGDCCVAISGEVVGSGVGPINEFMSEQGILNPPRERTIHGVQIPQAIITANALIAALPFAFLGGFDPSFPEAAGEDLDLGIRLRTLGVIAWEPEARVAHRFDENESDFYKRFRRYGRGNRRLELRHNLPCMRARDFHPEQKHNPDHVRLAKLAVEAMQAGYDEAVSGADRGYIRIVE